MSPDLDLRFRTMMAALTDIIMPALDPNNSLAKEQAGLLLGSLAMIRSQIDYSHAFETVDLMAIIALAERLKALIGKDAHDADQAVAMGKEVLSGRHATSALRTANRDVRAALRLLIERAERAGPQIAASVQKAVLAQSDEAIQRERAWVVGTGFDVFPETLKSIPASLGLDEK